MAQLDTVCSQQEEPIPCEQVSSSSSLPQTALVRSITEESLSNLHDRNNNDACSPQNQQLKFVRHEYVDYANELPPAYDSMPLTSSDITFPLKLYHMLEQVESDGHAHIVSWQPHGRCFVLHKPEIIDHVLGKYFNFSKRSTFQRQLNLYGFKRITAGKDRQGYYHPKFLRHRTFLVAQINRIKIKGQGHRAKANPEEEPDFWNMPWIKPLARRISSASGTLSSGGSQSSDEESSPSSVEELFLLGDKTISFADTCENWGRCFYDVDEGSTRLSL